MPFLDKSGEGPTRFALGTLRQNMAATLKASHSDAALWHAFSVQICWLVVALGRHAAARRLP